MFFIVLQGLPCVFGPLLPGMMTRFGARRLVTGGLVLLAVGEFWLAGIPVEQTSLSSTTARDFGLTVPAARTAG